MADKKTLDEFVADYLKKKQVCTMGEFAEAVAEFVYKKIRPSLFYTGDVQRADEVAKALGIERRE